MKTLNDIFYLGMVFILGVIISTLAFSNDVFSQNIVFNQVRTGGTGCPIDTTAIAYAPDRSSASLIFDRFEVRVPYELPNGQVLTQLDVPCNIFIDASIPQNFFLTEVEISYDIRGLYALDSRVSGNFQSFLMSLTGAGVVGQVQGRNGRPSPMLISEQKFHGSILDSSDILIRQSKVFHINSRCSETANQVSLHIQHHVFSALGSAQDVGTQEGMITIDSSDVTGGFRITGRLMRCRDNEGGGGRRVEPIPPRDPRDPREPRLPREPRDPRQPRLPRVYR
jgi:Domain of unknown function (DUF4360)